MKDKSSFAEVLALFTEATAMLEHGGGMIDSSHRLTLKQQTAAFRQALEKELAETGAEGVDIDWLTPPETKLGVEAQAAFDAIASTFGGIKQLFDGAVV